MTDPTLPPATDSTDSTDSTELAEALRSLQWRLRRRSHADVDDLGITPAQGRVLRVVGHGAQGPRDSRCGEQRLPRMGEVAERMRIAPRSLTDLVDPLETAGLLRRTQDPTNRRSLVLELTPEGEEVLDALRERSRATAATAFAVLDEEERAQLLALVRRVEAALDEGREVCHPQ